MYVCLHMYECELVDNRYTADTHNSTTHCVPHQHGHTQPPTYRARGRGAHREIQVSVLHQIYKKIQHSNESRYTYNTSPV